MNRKSAVRVVVYGGLLVFGLWVFGFFDRGSSRGPAAAPTMDPGPAGTDPAEASVPPFEVVDWRLIPATAVDKAKVVGEVRNTGNAPMGVQLQVVIRDPEKRVVGTEDFWPASVSDIAPGQAFAFSYRVNARPEDTVELGVIRSKSWK